MNILATIAIGASLLTTTATAATLPMKATAPFENRYVLSGTVINQCKFKGIETKTWCTIVDENGEEWVYAYDNNDPLMPPEGMKTCMIMDNNGTPDDITDDSIEDILWCDCDEDC